MIQPSTFNSNPYALGLRILADQVEATLPQYAPVPESPFRNVWDFLCCAARTKDEAAGQVRQFPAAESRYDYLRELSRLRAESRIFAVEKSRRMLITWWMLGEYLWDTITHVNHANFVGSRKMEASAFLLGGERMLFMYEHIPVTVWPDKPRLEPRGRLESGYTRLECPDTGSYVQAIASGADQLRQYTATNVLCDEFAFWDRAEESWSAMRPTIEGGGHIDLVSTPELGAFMQQLLYD